MESVSRSSLIPASLGDRKWLKALYEEPGCLSGSKGRVAQVRASAASLPPTTPPPEGRIHIKAFGECRQGAFRCDFRGGIIFSSYSQIIEVERTLASLNLQ